MPRLVKSKLCIFSLSLTLSTILSAAAFGQTGGTTTQGTTANAGSTSSLASAKIGIVNIQDAIIASNEGKKEFDGLQQRFAPKQNDLKGQNDEVENMKKDLQARQDKLSEDERAKMVKNLEAKQKTLQRNYEDAQNEFQQAEQEVVNRIGGKMLNALDKYARANNFTIIMDVSNPQTPVLWASQEANVTRELVDAYNAESPAAAPTAPKPAGATLIRPPVDGTTTPKKP